ncbi:MAG: 2OG-Fe(II) oxygenase [Calothrix sp. SM1_5_4]|nr:2OG-Fe(II) oxygenase [Calothrix sp. SM1_5_4]
MKAGLSVQHMVFDGFYPRAGRLRDVFDRKFADPLRSAPDRFVWDYWHVPGEYTLLRTPAYTYFPRRDYEHFHGFLVKWGRENLGCHDISPPWLSCYIDGCRQELHQDVPHGPLAFVFSLTPWRERVFRGGETFIQKPRALIEPRFNRLTVFNPALVHGVREVRGTHDPREGRLVVHGWFVNPRPFWVGPLSAVEVDGSVREGLSRILSRQPELGSGLLSLRLRIAASGEVLSSHTVVSTLRGFSPRDLQYFLKAIKTLAFPRKQRPTRLTLPLMVGS